MKAIRIHTLGGPEVMQFEDAVLPALQPTEVRLQHHAIGVNFLDVYFRTGLYPAPSMPFTPGNEGAGEVLAVGSAVREFKVGDRVAYATALGAYAQERNIDAKHLVKLPKSISYETGAAMMLKGLTAHYLLHKTFPVKKGDTILVHAAAGGVGLLLCQWGKALGATVIGTVGSPEKAKLAKKAGAKHVIQYNSEDFVARVGEITSGAKCDVVYDGIGKSTFMGSLDCLRPRGLMVSFGNASGAVDAFNPGILASKGSLFLTRPTLFGYTGTRKELVGNARDLMKAVASGILDIPIHARVPLAQAADAHRALESRATTGSTILIP